MSNLTKKQHYVWRHYLKAWASNEKIFAFLNKENKLIHTNLMGVAQERYFYQLEDLTLAEEAFLTGFVATNSHASLKTLNEDYLRMFLAPFKIKRELRDFNLGKELSFLEEDIRKLELNYLEHIHGRYEDHGHKLLAAAKSRDYCFLERHEGLFKTMMFICMQYVRTKKRKLQMAEILKTAGQDDLSGCFHMIAFVLAGNMAYNLSFSPYLRFTFLTNHHSQTYLTCDQPVFNYADDEKDSEGFTTGFELYYPLSPRLALVITREPHNGNWISEEEISQEQLATYNQKTVDTAESFLFADSEAAMLSYLNHH